MNLSRLGRFIRKLFGGKKSDSPVSVIVQPQVIDGVEYTWAPPAKKAAAAKPPKKPRRQRRSPEEIARDRAEALEELIAHARSTAAENQRKQTSAGITRYEWMSAGDERTCPACRKNDGRKFAWDRPPKTGHPGEGKLCPNGHCRCTAIAHFPRIK
jgi:SPP1 gp7 family putative phage head morphogenesis protein